MRPAASKPDVRHLGLGWFVAISFVLLWVVMVPAALAAHGMVSMRVPRGLQFLAEFAPTFAAIAVTASMEGHQGVNALWRSLLRTKVSFRWYAMVLFVPLATQLAALEIQQWAGSVMPKADEWYEWPLTVALYLPICVAQEELGWRGFFLARLMQRCSLWIATVGMAAAWGLWHLPVFLAKSSGQSYLIFLSGIIPASAWFSFVFSRTRSILLCGLLHASLNAGLPNWLASLPDEDARLGFGIWIGLFWLVTIPVFVALREENAEWKQAAGPKPTARAAPLDR